MMVSQIPTTYRYPGGSQSFQDTDLDRRLFFGRDREKEELLHLILAEKLVVLFARSGMGKTSLLNAGVLQELRQRGLLPLTIRVNDPRSKEDTFDLLDAIFQSIKRQAEQQRIEFAAGVTDSLWHYFKTVECWSEQNTLLTPVLIFDQFEDFFDFHGPERRRMFSAQLAAVLKGTVPAEVQAAIESGAATPYTPTAPNLKVLIALREDYLAQLEELAQDIPEILHNRYRLVALRRQDAEQAIIRPAALDDEHLATRSFQYDPAAVAALLDFLSTRQERYQYKSEDAIEPFQLQLLCQHIEKVVQARQQAGVTALTVQKSDLGGEKEMQRVLEHFYDDQIRRLRSPWKQWCVRRLCEKGLSSPTGRRVSKEEEEIARQYFVSPALLGELVDQRLLRAESRVGSVYYELSHDTLVKPIRNAQRKWRLKLSLITGVTMISLFLIAALLMSGVPTLKFFIFPNAQLQYQYGLRLYGKGRNVAAIRQFEKALELGIEPSALRAEVYFATGLAWYQTSNPERLTQTIRNFKNAIDEYPNHIQAHQSLGVIYREQGQCAQAVASFQKVRELDGESAAICYQLAQAYACQGSQAEARQYALKAFLHEPLNQVTRQLFEQHSGLPVAEVRPLLEAIQKNPWESAAYNNLAERFIERKQYEDAIAIFEIAAGRLPTAFDIYHNWGRVYYYQGQNEKAVEYYQKAIAGDPQNYLFANNLGYAFVKMQRNAEAIEQFQKVAALAPRFPNAYQGWGQALYQQGEYQGAIEQLEKALKIAPQYANAWYTLGQVYRAQGNKNDAERAFGETLNCQPRDVTLYAELAALYTQEKRPDRALRFIQKLLELKPDEVDAYYERGMLYKELRQMTEAQADFRKALELEARQTADAYYQIGQILSEQGRDAEAETYFKQAIARGSKYALEALYAHGQYLSKQRQYQDALAELSQVIASNSPLAKDAYYHQGLAYKALSETQNAFEAFQQAIQNASQYTAAAYYEIGRLLCQSQQYDQAFQALFQAFWRDPGNANYFKEFDDCLPERDPAASQAIRDAFATFHQTPNELMAYNTLAFTLLRYNHPQEALIVLNDALEMIGAEVRTNQEIPANAEDIYYALGLLQESQQQYDKAFTWYLSAFILHPESNAYYEALQQIWPKQNEFPESFWEITQRLHFSPNDSRSADNLQQLRETLNQQAQSVGVGQ